MHLPNEVYCWTLRRGMIILGTFTLVLHLILLANSVYVYSAWTKHKSRPLTRGAFENITFYCITWSILEILANAALLRGVMKKNWQMLLPWLLLYGFLIVKVVIFNICFYFLVNTSSQQEDMFEISLLVQSLIIIALVYICYSFLCVLSLYRKFRLLNLPTPNQVQETLVIDNVYPKKDATETV